MPVVTTPDEINLYLRNELKGLCAQANIEYGHEESLNELINKFTTGAFSSEARGIISYGKAYSDAIVTIYLGVVEYRKDTIAYYLLIDVGADY